MMIYHVQHWGVLGHRPERGSGATGQRMTSSAWQRRLGGIVRPRAWAVLRLMTSSHLVGGSPAGGPMWCRSGGGPHRWPPAEIC
jgi:hypothetical protein